MGVGGIVIGTAIGWNSPVMQLRIQTNADWADDVRGQIALETAGCYCLGTVFGCLAQGQLVCSLGFRYSLVLYNLLVFVGWLIVLQVDSAPFGAEAIWIGRLVQGMGIGGLSLLIPTYISHITDYNMRGTVADQWEEVFYRTFLGLFQL